MEKWPSLALMVIALVLIWVAAVVVLAGRGHKAAWLAGLLGFPILVAVLLALDPSFRGAAGRDYLTTGAIVAALIWVMAGLASAGAWFIGKRARS
jgi:hypothetical protein